MLLSGPIAANMKYLMSSAHQNGEAGFGHGVGLVRIGGNQ